MRATIATILLPIMLLSCSWAGISTGTVQQYRGQQLSPSEEATLNYTNANNGGIIIDGVWLGEMKPLGDPDGWTECVGRRGKFLGVPCSGTIKLKPGVHEVTVWRAAKNGQIVQNTCNGVMESGVKYNLTYREEIIDTKYYSSGTTFKSTTWCEIKER